MDSTCLNQLNFFLGFIIQDYRNKPRWQHCPCMLGQPWHWQDCDRTGGDSTNENTGWQGKVKGKVFFLFPVSDLKFVRGHFVLVGEIFELGCVSNPH